jgi:hypothetical protein
MDDTQFGGSGNGYFDNLYLIEMGSADLSGEDGWVDANDLSLFTAEWLRTDCDETANANCNGADLDFDGDVDLGDFSYFGAQWMACLWEFCE